MTALKKLNAVMAVEKHGGLLVLDGIHEKAEQIFDFIYAKKKELLFDKDDIAQFVESSDLDQYNMIIIGCPGTNVPKSAFSKLKDYVRRGGWLLTTDWCLKYIIEKIFPGYIAQGGIRTGDAVVKCQLIKPNHPFLEGVLSEIRQEKWSKGDKEDIDEFEWWIEFRSFPIKVLRGDVEILIASWEIEDNWGEAPVLVCFDYGHGKVIHMISHAVLQKGQEKGKYVSALIITNILEHAVSNKIIKAPEIRLESPKAAPQYRDPSEVRLESPKAAPQYTDPSEVRLESPKAAPQYRDPSDVRLESPKAAPQYRDPSDVRLESPKAAPQYTDPSDVRLESPKAAPQYTDPSDVRLEAPKAAPQYTSDYESKHPSEDDWLAPPKSDATSNITPPPLESKGLIGTSIIFESKQKPLVDICVYCLRDFKDFKGRIFLCKECGSFYHENCLTIQLDHGNCKKCGRILLLI